ncbi:MAG: hypothetical protein L0332_20430 [Chloroflexi bacterium]|nr:hypothetical protein [Chloroflexota bacterium]MCI0580270.1 hypothetical protein [Chloroflexota bacterium]MCI0643681.1 hypothetical protein [Chloroflexota bacterium]MCI0729065.1 hypothetical protein [Chloroflexota bacterium]
MIRVTVKDGEQTVSFLASEDTTMRLVAGCSVNPANLGELLVATDVYQRGLTLAVMAELMEFDKALRQKGPVFIHHAISLARARGHPLETAFQAIDEVTESEALRPRDCELVVIDLTRKTIQMSAGLEIPRSGVVTIHSGKALTTQTVTYILPQGWAIQGL